MNSYPTRSIRDDFKPVSEDQLQAAISRSDAVIEELLDQAAADSILIAFSGGKDSIVAAGIAARHGIVTGHCETAFCFQRDVTEYRAIARRIGLKCRFVEGLNLGWLARHQDLMFADTKGLAKYYAARQQRSVSARAKKMGAKAVIYGRRHEENTIPGAIYTRKDGLTQCNPIADWTHEEVWTYVLRSGFGYPKIYEHPVGRLNGAASWPEVSERLSREDGYHHLEIIHDYDPRVLPAVRHWRADVDAFLKSKGE